MIDSHLSSLYSLPTTNTPATILLRNLYMYHGSKQSLEPQLEPQLEPIKETMDKQPNSNTHHRLSDNYEFPKTQQHVEDKRHPIPPKVIMKMMIKETLATPFSPRNKCFRCGTTLIHKFLILVYRQWPNEPDYVCRLCKERSDQPVALRRSRK